MTRPGQFPTLDALGDRLTGEIERQLGTFVRIVGAADGLVQTGGAGLFYCFAAN